VSSASLRPVRWMGWLFVIGSACFAVGVPLSQVTHLSPSVAAATFFIGSIFFTSASSVQLYLAWDSMRPVANDENTSTWSRLVNFRDGNWSSSFIQWVGTIFFNGTTLAALVQVNGQHAVSNQVVWRPDAIGSILFLVSSAIALIPESRQARHEHVRDLSWLIAALNMVGSVFFGISAIGAWVVPDTNELLNSAWSNGGTFWGAVCFLVGAWLVIPRRRHQVVDTGTS
jgi:hypothetical protein